LTDFSKKRVGPKTLYRMAKSRWEIENGTFNDGKNRYGLKHIPHHQDNSLVIHWPHYPNRSAVLFARWTR